MEEEKKEYIQKMATEIMPVLLRDYMDVKLLSTLQLNEEDGKKIAEIAYNLAEGMYKKTKDRYGKP